MQKGTDQNCQPRTSWHHPAHSSPSPLHFFTPAPALSTSLVQHLNMKCLPYQTHHSPQDLDQLVASPSRGTKVLILVQQDSKERENDPNFLFPKNYKFPQSTQSLILRFYSLNPSQINSQLQGTQAILDFCQSQLKNESSQRIQFKCARSLSRSRQKVFRSTSPTKKVQPVAYQKIFYQSDSFPVQNPGAYQLFVCSLQNMEKAESFIAYEDLVQHISGRNQKYLVLTGSRSAKTLLSRIKQSKATHFDLVLLGQIEPSNLTLDPTIVLATSDPDIVSQFLSEQGLSFRQQPLEEPKLMQKCSMSSTDFNNIMKKIMKEDSQYSSNNIFRSSFKSGLCIEQKVVRYWEVTKDPNTQRFVTAQIIDSNLQLAQLAEQIRKKKYKGPGRSIFSQNSQDKEEAHQQPLLTSISKRSSAPFYNQLIQTNSSKPASDKQLNSNMSDMASSTPVKCEAPLIQPMFIYDHRQHNYPSNVIAEVSQEYRGSNKSSLVYLQKSPSLKQSRPKLSPHQRQNQPRPHQRQNQPRPHYYSPYPSPLKNNSASAHSSQRSVPSNQFNIYQTRIDSANSLQSIKAPPSLRISAQNIYSENGHGYASQSPFKVVKKTQLSTPQEIKYSDTKKTNPPSTPSKQTSPSCTTSNELLTSRSRNNASPVVVKQRTPLRRGTDQLPSPQEQNKPAQNHVKRYSVAPTSSDKKIHPAFHNSLHRQFGGFQKVERDGVVIYRRKQTPKEVANNQQSQQKPQVLPRVLSPVRPLPYHTTNPKRLKTQPQEKQQKVKMNDNLALVADSTHKKTVTTENSHSNGQSKYSTSQSNSPYTTYQAQRQQNIVQKLAIPQPLNNGKPKKAFNDSIFSKISDLHSDGSILRRNNIRFGVKTARRQQKIEPSIFLQQQSKLKSEIFRPNEIIRRKELNKVLMGQDKLAQYSNKMHHIDTKFNHFHFLVHEDLGYLARMLQKNLAKSEDRVETFANLQHMFDSILPEKTEDIFDAGFIITLKSHLSLINPKFLPQDYFLLVIDRSKGPIIEINEKSKKVKVDNLSQLPLIQKLIVQSKIYQYVAYRSQRKEVVLLADKFLESEFVLQKIQTQFTTQIIDFYYCELPRLTRLYILCSKQEVNSLSRLLNSYRDINPAFDPRSVKIICLINNILENDDLIMSKTGVTFVNNPEDLKDYRNIVSYAHYQDDPEPCFPIDHFFFHHRFSTLEMKLDSTFPGRFQPVPYFKLADIYPKVEKLNKSYSKRAVKNNNFLLLPESVGGQKLSTQLFEKVYMVGKGKSLHSAIVRVLNVDELIEKIRF